MDTDDREGKDASTSETEDSSQAHVPAESDLTVAKRSASSDCEDDSAENKRRKVSSSSTIESGIAPETSSEKQKTIPSKCSTHDKKIKSYQSLAKQGKLMLEFRAVLASNIELENHEELCVYLAHDSTHNPMKYDALLGMYSLEMVANKHKLLYEYKFCVKSATSIKWENLPYYGTWNKQYLIDMDQAQSGHAIIFEVIVFAEEPVWDFSAVTASDIPKLLPPWILIDLGGNTEEYIDTVSLLKTYKQWIKRYYEGINLVNFMNGEKKRFALQDLQTSSLFRSIEEEVNSLTASQDCVNHVKRILGVVLFLVAAHRRFSSMLFPEPLKRAVCNGMSLHDVDEHHQQLLLKELDKVVGYHDSASIVYTSAKFKMAFIRMFERLTDEPEPESILVLPLLKLVQNVSSSIAPYNEKPPTAIKWPNVREKLRRPKHNESLEKLVQKILSLSNTFPWIRKMYCEVLGLETATKLINSNLQSKAIFEIDEIFKKLCFFWRKLNRDPDEQQLTEEMVRSFYYCISDKLKENLEICEKECKPNHDALRNAMKWIEEISELLQLQVQHVKKHNRWFIQYMGYSMGIIDIILYYAKELAKKAKSEHELHYKIIAMEDDLIRALDSITMSHLYDDVKPEFIWLWNFLFGLHWSDEELNKRWITETRSKLVVVLHKKFDHRSDRFLSFYCDELEQMKPTGPVEECFSELMLDEIQRHSFDNKNIVQKFVSFFKRKITETTGLLQPKMVKMCTKMLEQKWKWFPNISDNDFEEKLLDCASHWCPPLLRLIGEKEIRKYLPSHFTKIVDAMKKTLEDFIQSLSTGTVTISKLQSLVDVKKVLWESYSILFEHEKSTDVDGYFSIESLSNLLHIRREEMTAFLDAKEALWQFVEFVSSAKGDNDVGMLGIDILIRSDVTQLPLNRLVECDVYRPNTISKKTRKHKVTIFNLSEEDLSKIMEIHKGEMIKSLTVQQKLCEMFELLENDDKVVNLHVVLAEMWPKIKQTMSNIIKKIENGTSQLTEVDELFARNIDRETDDMKGVEEELKRLYTFHPRLSSLRPKRMEKRLSQIQNYFKMRQSIEGATVLRQIQTQLELEGNFEELTKTLELSNQAGKEELLSMTENLVKTTTKLRDISNTQLKILEAFSGCGNLIAWLKEHMSHIGEVKVMSDLAMISAGDTPIEVDRVSCFLSAVMAFSPLIFDLRQDAGLDELLKACSEVWSNAERDPNLLKKWEETSKQLEWLNTVKDFHGSVEKSSLTRATNINEHGVYEVCCNNESIPSLENSLRLYLAQEGKVLLVMTLDELRDLQSRLMLIAGEADKGKQDVTRFMEVLSSVENLAKSYVKLKTAGCSLFNNWKASVKCVRSKERNATMEVYFDERSPAISTNDDVIESMQNLTTVLDEAHEQWIKYLRAKRDKHYHLNHFNIHQLTYLCKKLARNDPNDFPDQVYMLLASIAENVTSEKIADYLDEATKIDDEHKQEEESESLVEDDPVSPTEKKKVVVRKLVQMEISENMAKAAVQAVDSMDVDDCYLWALANDDAAEELKQQFDEEIGFENRAKKVTILQNVVNDRSSLTLKDVIDQIQASLEEGNTEGMATSVKTICERYFKGTAVTSLEDFLSLEHLGVFLSMLGNSVDLDDLPQRNWSAEYVAGKPNLIICKQTDDVWRTILSMYMHSPKQPLPTASEVLVCCESTSSEEVELLLRRAVGKPVDEGKRIYCLACADKLSFNVAQKAEETFQELIQLTEKNDQYRLVIITSSLQHYITSCFDEHKVDTTYSSLPTSAEDYLKEQLCRRQTRSSAAQVDRELSSVRVVQSDAAGMGKSLFVSRCHAKFQKLCGRHVYGNFSVIRFLEKDVDVDDLVESLINHDNGEVVNNCDPHFIHIDITPSVCDGVGKVLFDLLIAGMITNSRGVVWRHRPEHYYALEYTNNTKKQGAGHFTCLLSMFPATQCLSPTEVRDRLQDNPDEARISQDEILMDTELLVSPMYQRPYQYLLKYVRQENLDEFFYVEPVANVFECLDTLLRYCSIRAPSWSELSHFSKFLNVQLQDCEESVFCDITVVDLDTGLAGFKQFVVRFMIRMSQDFATPSLNVEDDNANEEQPENVLLELHQLRRRWESNFHPYLFFNHDRVSLSFVDFNVNAEGALCHPKTKAVVEENLMYPVLVRGLVSNLVNLEQEFDLMSRTDKLTTLCQVFGVSNVFDPDPTYELTTDNVLKMLAIHMRFRCGIPVIVMGETGCGKTRMVEFMSRLKSGGDEDIENMMVVKVHGGISVSIIQGKVRGAVELAKLNKTRGCAETTLFLDEANTTEAIYAIKEIVCDGTVHGKPFHDAGLRIVAACNPYKLHTEEVVKSMEKSGLGFHVKTEDVTERFDGIPMRRLVYRVIPLPPSMQPLVWDFGQLNNETEAIYINQMVQKLQRDINNNEDVPNMIDNMAEIFTKALVASQKYMRGRRDVCCFVSLRDVERTIQSFKWFYEHLVHLNPRIKAEKDKSQMRRTDVNFCMRALILALGMCYHVTLENRREYRRMLSQEFSASGNVRITQKDILDEIVACQKVFINQIQLEKDIGKNEALRENVFMIVMCAEMRIPLFLVGKPGSSKSLAKTIVTDAMQGRNSRSDLFKELKEIHVLSFQCSAVSDAVGIEAVFSQCAQLQKNRELDKYVATVVLDEIGLAEDSKKMPLKVLHPLLENASTNTRLRADPYYKVGFVGISNWALDPAKMNRGIFVTRGVPTKEDLHKTAEAIFESNKTKLRTAKPSIKAATDAYVEIYEGQEREFFGLRDYYSLMKMLFARLSEVEALEFKDIATAAMRNFSGSTNDILSCFKKHCMTLFPDVQQPHIPVTKLIHSNLKLERKSNSNVEHDSRFLLLLTKQYSAVSLLHEVMGDVRNYQVIFGSSFPHDHDYTEVCRNINKIKVCMETGRAVVLLNLRDLYESLYDALNQHYVKFSNQRYVDLGLGGHRVKCRVHPEFRLIVIEEKETVYNEFPIPLINRLEKYVFEMNSILIPNQIAIVNRLKEWVNNFSQIELPAFQRNSFTKEDAFVGYKDDTAASALLSQGRAMSSFEDAQETLLQTASLDGVCRLPRSALQGSADQYMQIYMDQQIHDTLCKFLSQQLKKKSGISVAEITSFSQVLTEKDRRKLQELLGLSGKHIMLLTLQQFQTEQEFSGRLDDFFEVIAQAGDLHASYTSSAYIMLIQCPQAQMNGNLIACAKYATMNKVKEFKQDYPDIECALAVCFLFTLERRPASQKTTASFTSFHCQDCTSVYIDELRPARSHIQSVSKLWNMTITEVLREAVVDVMQLFKESIPEAMGQLKNEVASLTRNRARVLTDLCFKNQGESVFMKTLVKQILVLLENREAKSDTDCHWIVAEACSPHSLQEGGSFGNVLWLRLRKLVALALAKITSEADADNNLDLLEDNPITDVWFQMLDSAHFLDLQWPKVTQGTTFPVSGKEHFNCQFPFIRNIYETLMRDWTIVHESHSEEKGEKLAEKISKSPLQKILDDAEGIGMTAIDRFMHDLVHLMYKAESDLDFNDMERKTVQACVMSLFKYKRENDIDEPKNALIEIFLLMLENKKPLQQFSEVIAARPQILTESEQWLEEQANSPQFLLHLAAFRSLITTMHDEAKDSFGNVDSCRRWKSAVVRTKQFAGKLLPNTNDDIQAIWKRIVFVEIFLDQLVPSSVSHERLLQYLKPLSRQARLLWVGSGKIHDLSSLKFLKIVIKTLQSCTKEIELHLLCDWNDIKCKACKADKLIKPVSLPCGHFICQRCISLKPDSNCPVCRRRIIHPERLTNAQLSAEAKKELETFKSACTSFFLEYLSTMCFPALETDVEPNIAAPLDEKVLMALEELVIHENKTKEMSPVLGNLDENPTARSYILRLLLRSNARLVEHHLERHFSTMAAVLLDKTALMEIYLQCLHDSLQTQLLSEVEHSTVRFDFMLGLVQEGFDSWRNTGAFNQIQHLDLCARLQFIANVASSYIYRLEKENVTEREKRSMAMFIETVCKESKNREFLIMRQFIIKHLCRRYGMGAFDILMANNIYQAMVPQNLVPAQQDDTENFYHQSDTLILSGRKYVTTKAILLDIAQDADVPEAMQHIGREINGNENNAFQVLLASSIWVSFGANNRMRQEVFVDVSKRCRSLLSTRAIQQFFNMVSRGALHELRGGRTTPQMQYKIHELLTVYGATVFSSRRDLLNIFQQMTGNPEQFTATFLPTMPGTDFNSIRGALQKEGNLAMHLCPNGHPYYIGECTRPVQQSKCAECGAPVGGLNHRLHDGNRQGQVTEQSQTGYKLGHPDKRSPSAPERNLSRLSVCATRICLHSAMLLGLLNGNAVTRLINFNGGQNEVKDFLLQHLHKDLDDLAKSLGRSIDDAVLVMHEILHRMRSLQGVHVGNFDWSSMQNRQAWEDAFQQVYLAPVFADASNVINRARAVLIDSGKLGEKPLERLVYELRQDEDVPTGLVPWDCPILWKYKIHADLQHLRQSLEAINKEGEGAALKAIVNIANLNIIQRLSDVVSVQSALIARYRQKIDMADGDEITLADFLEEDYYYEEEIDTYIKVWNQVRHFHLSRERYNAPLSYFDDDMTRDSPVSMCLPSKRGRGVCALLMDEYLIEKQNNLLHQCRELIAPKPRFDTINVADVSSKDLVCIEENRDLMPLIIENSQYEATVTEQKTSHNIKYNFGLMEKKVLEKFFVGKSFINIESIPLMQYPQDVGIAKDFEAIRGSVEQAPLPIKICQDTDGFVENAMTANVCEVVRTVSLIIQYLAKGSKVDVNQTICDYAEKELLLPHDETEMIPRSAQIRHSLALYERLSWHRSRRLVKNGQNPFENVINGATDITDGAVLKAIRGALTKLNITRLQLELNALLMVGPEVNIEWRLAQDVLLPYLEGKYDDDEEVDHSWCEQIPEEVLIKHAVHLFILSMEYKVN